MPCGYIYCVNFGRFFVCVTQISVGGGGQMTRVYVGQKLGARERLYAMLGDIFYEFGMF
jgi:hypothetical protein